MSALPQAQADRGSVRPPVPLGRTGLLVSRLGIGLAALGRPAYMTIGRDADLGPDRSAAAMGSRCRALLDAAYAAGIRYADVARSYGFAEQFLCAWWDARKLPADAMTVGSKWGYIYTGAWQLDAPFHEVKRLSANTLRRQASESCGILGKRLSLYQIHSATIESRVLDDTRVLTELARLRERGLRIGLTVTGPRQADTVRRALDVRVDGAALFQTVQATWNLLEPSAGAALAEARAEGWGVIVKEVLANGRLTGRYRGTELGPWRSHAASQDATLEAIAIAAALAQPWADVVLSGAVTGEQLDGYLAALEHGAAAGPLPPFEEPADTYWRRRAALAWS